MRPKNKASEAEGLTAARRVKRGAGASGRDEAASESSSSESSSSAREPGELDWLEQLSPGGRRELARMLAEVLWAKLEPEERLRTYRRLD